MKKWSSELYYHNPLPWKEVDASENNIRKITNTYNIKFYGIWSPYKKNLIQNFITPYILPK
jgi:hypothetical protein